MCAAIVDVERLEARTLMSAEAGSPADGSAADDGAAEQTQKVLLADKFDRADASVVGKPWQEHNEVAVGAASGGTSVEIEKNSLSFTYQNSQAGATSYGTLPSVTAPLGRSVTDIPINVSFTFSPHEFERIGDVVGLMNSAAGFQGGDGAKARFEPNSGVVVFLSRSSSLYNNSTLQIWNYTAKGAEHLASVSTRFQYQSGHSYSVHMTVNPDGKVTADVSDGTLTDQVAATVPALPAAFDQFLISDVDGATSWEGVRKPGAIMRTRFDDIVVTAPLNDCAPIADDQGLICDEDTPLEVILSATDPEGGDVTFSLVGLPENGTLLDFDPVTGRVIYLPGENFSGLDQFTFVASDGIQTGDPATVFVRVDLVNDAPAITPTIVTVDEDTSVEINLWDLVDDVETPDEELVFSVDGSKFGSATLLEDGHTVRFTPDANYNGTAQVAFSVTDTGQSDDEVSSDPLTTETASVDVKVLPINDAPVAANGTTSVREDGAASWPLTATDPDGDELTFQIVSGPAHGHISLDEATGELRYAPNEGFSGTDSVQFLVNDGQATSAIATQAITVAALQTGFQLHDGRLTIIGTKGNDSIRLERSTKGYNIVTTFGKYVVANRSAVSSIEVLGRAGNDTINLSALEANKTADVFGGAGNDVLLPGLVDDVLHEVNLRATLNAINAVSIPNDKLDALDALFSRLVDDGVRDTVTGSAGKDLFLTHTRPTVRRPTPSRVGLAGSPIGTLQ